MDTVSAIAAYLRNGNTLAQLQAEYGVNVRQHPDHADLVHVCYDMIDSPKHMIPNSARGHILEVGTWTHVCRPFDRFFNSGEGAAVSIDWSSARSTTKEDGSLLCLWYYGGRWQVSTKGSPNAGGNVGDRPFTFSQLFWDVWSELGYRQEDLTIGKTYVFELLTPWNKVVVRQNCNRLVLIAVRDNLSGEETDVREYAPYLTVVKSYDLNDLQDITATFAELDPLNFEGYVVVDKDYNRIKVKHPGYVALHHMVSGMSRKNILELVRQGESSEFLTYFPEYSADFLEIQGKYLALVSDLDTLWEAIKDLSVGKEFAMGAQKSVYPGPLFEIKRRGTPIKVSLREASLDNLSKILKL